MKKNVDSRRDFIKKSLVVASAAGLGQVSEANRSRAAEPLPFDRQQVAESPTKAAFAEKDITPALGMEQPGGYGKVLHKSIHDPCKVRASVFNDGTSIVSVVSVDALMLSASLVAAARKRIQSQTGIPADAILICATHSHSSGPTGMVQPGEFDWADSLVKELAYDKSSCANAAYLETVENQIVAAVSEAHGKLAEVEIGVGRGLEDQVAFNRRFFMKNGLTYTHPGQLNPDIVKAAGPIDPEVGVVGVWDKNDKCIGCMVNYTCHTTTNPGGVSANWVYYLEQTIRGAFGPECVVVFIQGAAGDVTQVDNRNAFTNRQGERWARFVGARVGAEAVKVLLDMPRGTLSPLGYKVHRENMKRRLPSSQKVKESLAMVKKNPEEVGVTKWTFAKEIVMLDAKAKKAPTVPVEIQVIQIGPVAIVANPSEYFCQFGLDIKMNSPFEYTFISMLANGCVGYVPTREAFASGGGGYETRLTLYSNLEIAAGDRMAFIGIDLARQLKPGDAPIGQKAPDFSSKPWEYGSVAPELA
ncbi:twin-arginine translocation signal domain-containing protein [Dyadobacter sp. CY323]|uniref:twin-arginine translocation signal domain-containing protein n=1 Tax=Dyadobacter sp. CY323 TaxID=2907302 RepID=UPI001F35D015|nr:twin-arginine translocation signal domain-containing protein [Dyadobacter sp. CY323]MCE6991996.1 twin-arginine translocation signal domain-containing protein [Dyadobacter sp. CY323]